VINDVAVGGTSAHDGRRRSALRSRAASGLGLARFFPLFTVFVFAGFRFFGLGRFVGRFVIGLISTAIAAGGGFGALAAATVTATAATTATLAGLVAFGGLLVGAFLVAGAGRFRILLRFF